MSVGRIQAGRALAVVAFAVLAFFSWSAAARAAAPANDDFAKATALPAVLAGEKEGTNVEATKEAGEPNHAGNPGGHSVWFSWTPSSSGPVGIQSAGCFGVVDALVAVYTGPSVGSLTPVASNATPSPPSCFFSELPVAEFEASAGTTYWIAVDGRDGAEGNFQLQFKHPPANDDFGSAQTIVGDPPQNVFGTLRLASKEIGEPDHAGDAGGHSVWYSWTPSQTEPVKISTCDFFGSLDTVLAVYTGSSLGALTPVASNDDAAAEGFECSYVESAVTFTATAGTTYRIAVDGVGGAVNKFNLQIQGRPGNDDFADAQELSSSFPSFGTQGSNRFATAESGEPQHAGTAGGSSVWFSWTPASDRKIAISTCENPSTDLDTLLAVYTGSSLGSLTPVASDDDSGRRSCGRPDSEVRFQAQGGTTYWIAVDGKAGTQGRFDLNFEASAANDAFAAAETLPADFPTGGAGSTRFASKEPGEPNHAGDPGGGSVWFSWTPTSSGPVAISTCPYGEFGPDTLLAVYTGSSLGALTTVAANDDSPAACRDLGSEVEIEAVAGTTYRIAVDSKGGNDGNFALQLSGRPDNDDFSAAQDISSGCCGAGGTTVFASKETGEPNHADDPGGHSVWFSWTPSSSGPAELTSCGTQPGVDTLLGVYTGATVTALTQVAANDDLTGSPFNEQCNLATDSQVSFQATAGTTYWIAVDTKNGEGRFGLYPQSSPANDAFADASQLAGSLPIFTVPLTPLAGKEAGEPDHAGDGGGHSVWYSWTAPTSGSIAVSTCTRTSDLDVLLAVYTGSAVGALTPVAGDDDGAEDADCRPTDAKVEFAAVAGTTYRIAVDGKSGSSGTLQLILEGTAASDDFGKAQPLGAALPTQAWTSNRFGSKQAGEDDHAGNAGGASVWFKWTAPRSGEVSVDTCDSSFDTLLAVYTGSKVDGLTPVASNDDASGKCSPRSQLSFDAVANTVYRIAVDGRDGAEGRIWLHIDPRPENDDFSKPMRFGGVGIWAPGSTSLATEEAGEPDHMGDPGGHSVWFEWTPSKSVTVDLDLCSRSFEPLLGLYTGSSLGTLVPVPVTDVGSGECNAGRSFEVEVHSDTTYRIAVDSAAGEFGQFLLHLRPQNAIFHSLSVAKGGGGSGSVTSGRIGIDCGPTCSRELQEGTSVSLQANPAPGSTFVGWSGGGCSGTGPCQVGLKSDVAVTATFAPQSSDGGQSTGGGATPPPAVTPPPIAKPPAKPIRCKRGFKKKRVHGKVRCVRKHKKQNKQRR
ncbi:MAG TPA: hypothetical protein VFX35_12145 [Solirubrobacterales bacterium]|nr:hypothetical protein [Solirubrobacterales bacterium]